MYISLLILLCSCKKENHTRWTEININAKNYLTGEPIEDVSCGVLYFDGKTNVVLDAGLTENGRYSFGFKWKKNKIHWAEASIPIDKYYTVKFANNLVVEMGEINNYQFDFAEFGYLNFDLKNNSCFDLNDQIVLKRTSETGYNGYTDVIILGCYEDSTNIFGKVPAGRWFFEWQVTKNNNTEVYFDTIYLNPGESKIYEIDY